MKGDEAPAARHRGAAGTSSPERWRSSRVAECCAVLVGLLLAQAALLAVDAGPYFFSDTGTYFYASADLVPRRDRPLGLSLLYAGVGALSSHPVAFVVAQSLLMTAAGLLAYLVCRELRCPRVASAAAAVAVTLSPASLLFQRLLIAEALASVALVATAYFGIVAVRRKSIWLCSVAGLSAAALVLTKTSFQAVPVALLVALIALWPVRALRARGTVALVLVAASFLPLYGYSRYSEARIGLGSLSPWAGMVLFARTAPLLDCSDPQRPPAIRAPICAEGAAGWTYNEVLYRPGTVANVFYEPPQAFEERNAELRTLALESLSGRPLAYLRGAAGATAGIFGPDDADAPGYTAGPSEFTREGLEEAGVRGPYDQPRPLLGRLVTLLPAWFFVRLLIPAALLGLVLTARRSGADRRWSVLGGLWLVSLAPLVVLAGPFARYAFPLESVGWPMVVVGATAVARRVSGRSSARRLGA